MWFWYSIDNMLFVRILSRQDCQAMFNLIIWYESSFRALCDLWSMKLYSCLSNNLVFSRSRFVQQPNPDLKIYDIAVFNCTLFTLIVVTLRENLSLENHWNKVEFSIFQKIKLMKKCCKIYYSDSISKTIYFTLSFCLILNVVTFCSYLYLCSIWYFDTTICLLKIFFLISSWA